MRRRVTTLVLLGCCGCATADATASAVCAVTPTAAWCGAKGGLVGAACGGDADCVAPLRCETRPTGGYCTATCGPAPASPCPEGAGGRCIKVAITGGGSEDLCLRGCDDGITCRPETPCAQVGTTNIHVCFPSF